MSRHFLLAIDYFFEKILKNLENSNNISLQLFIAIVLPKAFPPIVKA